MTKINIRTMQSITTSFLGATNTKPARIRCKASAGTKFYSYHGLDVDSLHAVANVGNDCAHHLAAALAYSADMGWEWTPATVTVGAYPEGFHVVQNY